MKRRVQKENHCQKQLMIGTCGETWLPTPWMKTAFKEEAGKFLSLVNPFVDLTDTLQMVSFFLFKLFQFRSVSCDWTTSVPFEGGMTQVLPSQGTSALTQCVCISAVFNWIWSLLLVIKRKVRENCRGQKRKNGKRKNDKRRKNERKNVSDWRKKEQM